MKNLLYITQLITPSCLVKRKNQKNFSQSAINKSLGIAELSKNAGYNVFFLSPSLINEKTGKIHFSFQEIYLNKIITHALVIDIPILNIFSSIIFNCFWLIKNRKTFGAVIFYNYRPETALPAFFSFLFLKKPIYLDYEDGYFALNINFFLKKCIRLLEWFGNFFISGAIVVNAGLEKRLKTKNVQVIPGVIDTEIYNKFAKLPPKKNGKKIIMYSGSLDSIRGVDLFLELAESLIKQHAGDYQFWISGKGELEKKILNYAHSYPDKIIFYGFTSREKLLKLYEEVDAFVSLQKPEHIFSAFSYPSKVYEYLSTGKTVIGYDFSYGKTDLGKIRKQIEEIIMSQKQTSHKEQPQIVNRIKIFSYESSYSNISNKTD